MPYPPQAFFPDLMKAFRSAILHFLSDPRDSNDLITGLINEKAVPGNRQDQTVLKNAAFEYYPDGILLVGADGCVIKVDEADKILTEYPDLDVTVYENSLLTPGFVDTHTHMPQTQMIAAYGEQLLQWLENYTFPLEASFADRTHCDNIVKVYLTQLLKNGTTTANVFCTVHKHSAESFFEHCLKLNVRMIGGKVLMDRNCPANLQDTPQSGYDDSKDLIEAYHGRGRCLYSITPRFAPTSTPEQLKLAGDLFQEYKDRGVHMHTHLSENKGEIDWVTRDLFKERKGYLDVYDHYNLIGPRATFAHCVHLEEFEKDRLAETGSSIAFCPTSNLFLGSGLLDIDSIQAKNIRLGVGTDTAAGTSFSVGFQTMNEAYKVMQLQGKKLNSYRSFYLSTLGGARSLYIDDKIGNFLPGKEADFVVIDLKGTPYYDFRHQQSTGNLHELIFSLNILGDDRMIKSTYVMGSKVWDKTQETLIEQLLQ